MIDKEIEHLEKKIDSYNNLVGCIVLLNKSDYEKYQEMKTRLKYLKKLKENLKYIKD